MSTTTARLVFPPLQSRPQVGEGDTYVEASPATVLWGRLPSPADPAVARISAGRRITVDTVSHEGLLKEQGGDPVAFFRGAGFAPAEILQDAIDIAARVPRSDADGPHVVIGPIAVEGAKPGDLLAVTIEALEMRVPYGVISTRPSRGVLQSDETLDGAYSSICEVVEAEGRRFGRIPLHPGGEARASFPLAPFLGIVGVTPDAAGRMHSTPPGPHGGNLDISLLGAGSTIFIPVQVPDAGLYVGDPHYAQGNGEVALTALEAPLRATLRVDVVPQQELGGVLDGVEGPFAVAPGTLIAMGLSESLDTALSRCARNAVSLLTALVDIDERQAYLYLSAAADFSISQAVDIVKGVHGTIRLSDFESMRPTPFAARIAAAAQ